MEIHVTRTAVDQTETPLRRNRLPLIFEWISPINYENPKNICIPKSAGRPKWTISFRIIDSPLKAVDLFIDYLRLSAPIRTIIEIFCFAFSVKTKPHSREFSDCRSYYSIPGSSFFPNPDSNLNGIIWNSPPEAHIITSTAWSDIHHWRLLFFHYALLKFFWITSIPQLEVVFEICIISVGLYWTR